MRRERTSILPAVLFSALVHAVLLLAALVYWPKPMEGGGTFGITPVTLVAQGPVGNTQADVPPTPDDMATPEPVPDEEPAVVTPPTPAPVPTPAPSKSSKSSTPATSGLGNRAPADNSFLDQLSQSLKGGGGSKQSGGQQGRAGVRQGTPTAATGGCLTPNTPCPWKEGLGEKIERYWNPNCDVEGGDSVKLVARVTFNTDGFLIGKPEFSDARTGRIIEVKETTDPREIGNADVTTAAATRALTAIRRILPYSGVPRELVGRRIVLNLNADKACR